MGEHEQGCSTWAGGCSAPAAWAVWRLMRARAPISVSTDTCIQLKHPETWHRSPKVFSKATQSLLLGLISQFCPVNRDYRAKLICLLLCVSALGWAWWGKLWVHKSWGFESCVYLGNRNRPGLWQRGAPVIVSQGHTGPAFGLNPHPLPCQRWEFSININSFSVNINSSSQTEVLGFFF